MKQIVYVASPESQQIDVWQLADSGTLTWLQTVPTPGQVQPMVLHPERHTLYVGVRPSAAIVSYQIQADGCLQQAGVASLPAGPTHISTDLAGDYLFAVSYSGNCLSVSPIADGAVVAEPILKIDQLNAPHSANFDAATQRLWVPCLKEDAIRLFDFSADGQLIPHQPAALQVAAGAGPRHMVFHPNQRFAYCVNELNGTVDLFCRDDQGHYQHQQSVNMMPADFSGTCWAADIHLTPDGRFLYTSDRTTSLLAIFSLCSQSGQLTLLGHHPTEQQPRGFNLDHSGRFVISAGQKSGHIAVDRIDTNSGLLTHLARYPVGSGPMWVCLLLLADS
ncbi:6-phosphogluconolactonase [Serratia microhaemolytica]|uniref:6-phosphogluconolactonase n=1 Tax=Serratia microhaemolytica TaxID=2675110 RepID=UPI000FDD5D26|nr:6-phosphogluconolactonase [Serratia microhaemolytica]